MCLTLAKARYFGGNPEDVSKASAEWIVKTFDYEMFMRIYEEQIYSLNKNEDR